MPKKVRQQQRQPKIENNNNFGTLKTIVLSCVVVIVAVVVAVFFKRYFIKNSKAGTPYQIKASQVITAYVNRIDTMIESLYTLEQMNNDDVVVKLITSQLQPIRARVTDLMLKTKRFEDLKQVPSSFVNTTLEELKDVVENQLEKLDTEIRKQIRAVGKEGNALMKTMDILDDILDNHRYAIFSLFQEDVILDWGDERNPNAYMGRTSPETSTEDIISELTELRDALERLIEPFKSREEFVKWMMNEKLNKEDLKKKEIKNYDETDVGSVMGHFGKLFGKGDEKDVNSEFKKRIQIAMNLHHSTLDEIDKNKTIYAKTQYLLAKGITRQGHLALNSLKRNEQGPWYALRGDVVNDINNLRKRVKRLQQFK